MLEQPTKKELQEKILNENLDNNKQIRYSLTKKYGNMFGSIASKNILLIFSPSDNQLYYTNQGTKLPVVSEANLSKFTTKDRADILRSTVNNPPGTNELIIKYPKANEKGVQNILQWKFEMTTKGLAQQWRDMLQKHKDEAKKKTVNPDVNKSLINNNFFLQSKPKEEKKGENQHLDILMTESKIIKENPSKVLSPKHAQVNPQKNKKSTIEQSRISQAFQHINLIRQSNIKPKNQSSIKNDWNFRFVKNPSRQTVYEFQMEALPVFRHVYNDSRSQNKPFIRADLGEYIVQIADVGTFQAKKLKNQYRNYHYIIQCSQKDFIIGVPLTCLIQYNGYVGLVKAKYPKDINPLKNKRDSDKFIENIQHRTKISNSIILSQQKCKIYDLTEAYGSNGQYRRYYLDDLSQYLPQFRYNKEKDDVNSFNIRPQLIQQTFQNRLVPGGSLDSSKGSKHYQEFSLAMDSEIQDIADSLSRQQFYLININDFKQFLHYRGVNLKFLHKIYQCTKNKFVKKYLQTCLVAKLIKDEINISLNEISSEGNKIKYEQIYEDTLRYFLQGKNSTSTEYWKRLAIKHRNEYGFPMNSNEILGGFLLSCLITLIPAKYDISKLDKNKIMFKDQGIINKGFVRQLVPKVKTYYRFDPKFNQTVEICQYTESQKNVCERIIQNLNLQNKKIPDWFLINHGKQYISGYLSDFVGPENLGQKTIPCSKQIYSLVNLEPPSAPSIKVTLNYIKQCVNALKNNKIKPSQSVQQVIRESIEIINYWLELQHPQICDFYQKISYYEDLCGNIEDSLQILQKSIEIANKSEVRNNSKLGKRYYAAGCQYLKCGRKKDAMNNLNKAKQLMQKNPQQQCEYALTLLRLSSLELNSGDTEKCIKYGKQALKLSEKTKLPPSHSIKIYQILCRAFEIKGDKDELKKLSVSCSRQYNNTQDRLVVNEMIKICLTGTIGRLNIERSRYLLKLAERLKQNKQLQDQQKSLDHLMVKAKQGAFFMDIFMAKAENAERYLTEYQNHKQSIETKQFTSIMSLLCGSVGIDFIQGLHQQKEFE